MKEKMSKLIETIKANKTRSAVLAAVAVVAVTGIVAGACAIAKNQGSVPMAPAASDSSETEEKVEATASEAVETENVENEEAQNETSESAPSETVTAQPTTKPSTNNPSEQPAPTTPTTQPVETQPETTPTPTVVQAADPNTGISWDGVSTIIYTYPDGSTGTTPRPGAKYEKYPGMITEIHGTFVSTGSTTHCDRCGKKTGDGLNGTCVSWLMGDVTCPNCGTFVPCGTCHYCK